MGTIRLSHEGGMLNVWINNDALRFAASNTLIKKLYWNKITKPYGGHPRVWSVIVRYIAERDNHACKNCGKEECCGHTAHHVDGDSANNHPSNLLYFCSRCNRKKEFRHPEKAKERKERAKEKRDRINKSIEAAIIRGNMRKGVVSPSITKFKYIPQFRGRD